MCITRRTRHPNVCKRMHSSPGRVRTHAFMPCTAVHSACFCPMCLSPQTMMPPFIACAGGSIVCFRVLGFMFPCAVSMFARIHKTQAFDRVLSHLSACVSCEYLGVKQCVDMHASPCGGEVPPMRLSALLPLLRVQTLGFFAGPMRLRTATAVVSLLLMYVFAWCIYLSFHRMHRMLYPLILCPCLLDASLHPQAP